MRISRARVSGLKEEVAEVKKELSEVKKELASRMHKLTPLKEE